MHRHLLLTELLVNFFDYWARRHDYVNAVVSIRQGKLVSKASKDWTRRMGSERHLVSIEDPFEVRCVGPIWDCGLIRYI